VHSPALLSPVWPAYLIDSCEDIHCVLAALIILVYPYRSSLYPAHLSLFARHLDPHPRPHPCRILQRYVDRCLEYVV